MNYRYIVAALSLFLVACSDKSKKSQVPYQDKTGKNELASLQWQDTLIDLGTVAAGKEIPIVFYVKNTSKVPLIFERIESTCGCTLIKKEINRPIEMGALDSIVAQFKMSEAQGYVYRKIYVVANTPKQFYVLKIKANVVEQVF